ncbi:MAG: hypothetical protein IKQ92_03480 [Clostridia bacterium]|nr:hypothetical protein [Clostridia bacterium]
MTFYSQNGLTRPVRLTEATRRFAYDSLNHKYGLDTRKTPAVTLDDAEGYDSLTPLERYDLAVSRIARDAPIRICEGEKLSGAATLGNAIGHVVPATYHGETVCRSVSHLTIDFETVLKKGIRGIRQETERSLEKYAGGDREPFVRSCLSCLDSFALWHARYLEALEGMPEYAANLENLRRVPMDPPESFYEAVQSIWFVFAFTRLCGNWPGIGRLDFLLGDYLKADLEAGRLTLDEAREILAHFFIKGCEWVSGGNYGSGDAQHYQNIVLCGVDRDGREVTNEVTMLTLDVLEELGISDFPTTVRLSRNTDEKLLRRVAEVMRFGGGILAVYNEDLIIDALTKYGYELGEARSFANDGCWEVQVPGATDFSYLPFDSLQILQKETLCGYAGDVDYPDYESLYARFVSDLKSNVDSMCRAHEREFLGYDDEAGDWRWTPHMPCTVVSLFERACVERGLSYLEGGPVYRIRSPHIGGLADTASSLYAMKKIVYDEKRLTLPEFLTVLKNNWEGEELLRQTMLRRYTYYGNDNDEADEIAARVLNDFADICDSRNDICGFRFPAGVSTFGRQLEWSGRRLAAPHGRKAGEVLAANCSPTPGTDLRGATAVIRSYCKADLTRMVTGAALDIRLLPGDVKGEEGLDALCALMRGFVALGGFFMQPDIADAAVLREAQEHPEDYGTLSVRVSGWNARFVTLNREWQDMIIAQNEK